MNRFKYYMEMVNLESKVENIIQELDRQIWSQGHGLPADSAYSLLLEIIKQKNTSSTDKTFWKDIWTNLKKQTKWSELADYIEKKHSVSPKKIEN